MRLPMMRLRRAFVCNVALFLINVGVFVCLCTYAFERDEDVFRRGVMLSKDRRVFKDMVKQFFDATEAARVTCFIQFGTLLGSYRHHDMIPWDDDMDIMCNNSQRAELKQVLQSLAPKYGLHQYRADDMWKFFAADHAVSRGFIHRGNYRWPFIDIVFFVENATHVWSQNTWVRPRFAFARRYVFPLSRRPFSGLRVPVPCDTGVVVHTMFHDLTECVSREHSHRIEVAFPRYMTRRIPCAKLANSFPFVHHQVLEGGFVNETLRLGNMTMYSIVLPPCGDGTKSTHNGH